MFPTQKHRHSASLQYILVVRDANASVLRLGAPAEWRRHSIDRLSLLSTAIPPLTLSAALADA